MPVVVHFIDVGQGNMALIQAGGVNAVCDCNIRDDNRRYVLAYLASLLPQENRAIDVFINTHRDADHMAGIDALNAAFPIRRIWDGGAAGGSCDTEEYTAYMRLRRQVPESAELHAGHVIQIGSAAIRILHSPTEQRPDDCNRESLVFKLEYCGNSVLFAGDCDTTTWKRVVATNAADLDSAVLLAPHHGAIGCLEGAAQPVALRPLGFSPVHRAPGTLGALAGLGAPAFPSPRSTSILATLGQLTRQLPTAYYEEHLKLIRPYITVISVGLDNQYDHPSPEAVRIYERHTIGIPVSGRPQERVKVLRTDTIGSIFVSLPDYLATSWTWYPSGG